MKRFSAIILILFSFIALEACRYSPQSQTWHPKGHGSLSTKKPRAYRK